MDDVLFADFYSHISKGQPMLCWRWNGPYNIEDVPIYYIPDSRPVVARYWIYLQMGGRKRGEWLSKCKNALCVCPLHLTAVSSRALKMLEDVELFMREWNTHWHEMSDDTQVFYDRLIAELLGQFASAWPQLQFLVRNS
jgi:hypothetical protein